MTQQTITSAPLRLPHIVALYIGSVLGCGILILPGLAAEARPTLEVLAPREADP